VKATIIALPAAAAFLATLAAQTTSSTQQKPTFRAETRLVQVSVVVQDKARRPVPDLTAADFQLLEDGKEQPIALFSVQSETATRVVSLPPGTFTNRFESATASGVTVILFDRLNTLWEEQGHARQHLIKFLGQLRPSDRVGLYVLESTQVRVVHDFTSDASSLLRALQQVQGLTSVEQAAGEEKIRGVAPVGIASVDAETERWLRETQAQISGFFLTRRAESTVSALEAIAGYLRGVRGRKNLIWISGAFPALFNDAIAQRSMYNDLVRATRALNAADVAIYPVDARGLVGTVGGRPADKSRPFTTMSSVMGNVDTMRVIADNTGGQAYYNTNDLGTAITRAVDDSRLTYVLGYYPSHNRWDGRFRRIAVKVRRRDVEVRHRQGYRAFPAVLSTSETRQSAIARALVNPFDATAIPVAVRFQPGAARDSVLLTIEVDPTAVTLAPAGDLWEGKLDLAIAQALPDGRQFSSLDTTIPLRFTTETRDQMLRDGLSLTRTITLRPDLHQVRVVARDDATGEVGTVTIPAARLTASGSR
jgi:VWFA-related protein